MKPDDQKASKRFLKLLLVLTLAVLLPLLAPQRTLAADTVGFGSCGDNLSWTLDSDGVLTISGTGAMTDFSSGNPGWYSMRTQIKKLVVKTGVTTIGDYAFNSYRELTEIELPNTKLTAIGEFAFSYCTNLTTLTVTGLSTTIRNVLPGSLTTIRHGAFYNCTSLETIYLNSAVTTLGSRTLSTASVASDNPFAYCSSLKEIKCNTGSSSFTSVDGVLMNKAKTKIYAVPGAMTGSYTAPSTVKTVGRYAFCDVRGLTSISIPGLTQVLDYGFISCRGLTAFTFPSSAYALGTGAFSYCENLESITLGSGFASFEPAAFPYCTRLSSINVSSSSNYFSSLNGMLASKDKKRLVFCPPAVSGELTIPEGVTTIAASAFSNVSGLIRVTLPSTLTTLEARAFQDCSKLERIDLQSGPVTLTANCFSNLKALVYCPNPAVYSDEQKKAAGSWVVFLQAGAADPNMLIDQNTINTYSGSTGQIVASYTWKLYGDGHVTVESYGDTRFEADGNGISRYAKMITSIEFPEGFTSISGFSDWTEYPHLEQIKIPSTIRYFDYLRFSMCPNLKSVVFPDNADKIGMYAFERCYNLESITFGSAMKFIGAGAFKNCDKLTTVNYPGEEEDWRQIVIEQGNRALWDVTGYLPKDAGTMDGTIRWEVDGRRLTISGSGSMTGRNPEMFSSDGCFVAGFTKYMALIDTVIIGEGITHINTSEFFVSNGGDEINPIEIYFMGGPITINSTYKPFKNRQGTAYYDKAYEAEWTEEAREKMGNNLTWVAICTHKNTQVTPAIAPSCDAPGFTEEVICSDCQEVLTQAEEIPANGHSMEEESYEAPTCTTVGYTASAFCTVCGYREIPREEIPAPGHVPTVIPGTFASCTEPGITDGSFCQICGETLISQAEIPAAGHTPVVDEAVPPTCTEAGRSEGSHCGICQTELKAQTELAPLGHSMGEWEVIAAASCTENGTLSRSCTRCGLTETDRIEGGHIWDADYTVDIQPTCTADGSRSIHCSRCEVTKDSTVIPAAGHQAVTDEALAPTCTEAGLTEGSHCQVCGTVLAAQQTVKKLGHVYVTDEAIDPTCTTEGLTEGLHCGRCGETLVAQTVLEKLPHTIVTVPGTAPTCIRLGWTDEKYCSVCEEILEEKEPIPAKGHTPVILPAQEADCVSAGKTEGKKCSACDQIIVRQEEIAPLGHAWVHAAASEPTCLSQGNEAYSFCSRCDAVEGNPEPIPAKGHSFTVYEGVPATCTQSGLSDGSICQVCGHVEKGREVLEPLGHRYDTPWQWDKDGHWRTCSRCGESSEKAEHLSSGPATETKPETCTACGYEIAPVLPPKPQNPFTDISKGAYYYDAVLWAVENNITNGTDGTHFAPDQNCTRGQVVAFLWRAKGCPEPVGRTNPFADVDPNRYYYKPILWAYENGITSGVDATHFAPDAEVTRAQFVTFLWRSEGKPKADVKNPFVDVAQNGFTDAILWAYETKITTGKDATHFQPNVICTRANVVAFLYRNEQRK